jgi:hypothetical protein
VHAIPDNSQQLHNNKKGANANLFELVAELGVIYVALTSEQSRTTRVYKVTHDIAYESQARARPRTLALL